MKRLPTTAAGMMMRRIADAAQNKMTSRNICELGMSLLGPRPKQIGVGAALIEGRIYPTRIFESIIHETPVDFHRRVTPRSIAGSFKRFIQ